MTDSIPVRRPTTQHSRDGVGARGSYLPSAQVLDELARLGPDLTTLAEELRTCLSEPGDERMR
ncbi:MAG TPA: hypothetical protein VMA32_13840 [Streptosporangiaceae bacterium]|nr:hypothetical protein [Streptosporangiaceae bacterium]